MTTEMQYGETVIVRDADGARIGHVGLATIEGEQCLDFELGAEDGATTTVLSVDEAEQLIAQLSIAVAVLKRR